MLPRRVRSHCLYLISVIEKAWFKACGCNDAHMHMHTHTEYY